MDIKRPMSWENGNNMKITKTERKELFVEERERDKLIFQRS